MYGRGLSKDVAAAGATLIIASRNKGSCEAVAKDIREAGFEACAEGLDQGSEDSILRLWDRVMEKFGRVDGLVNNSVVRPMRGPESDTRAWEDSMKVNATGVYLMHWHFGKVMTGQGSGSIVNIGSIMEMTGPSPALYEGTDIGRILRIDDCLAPSLGR